MTTKRLDSTPLNTSELNTLLEMCRIAHDHLMNLKHSALHGVQQSPGASALYGEWARHATHLILRLTRLRKDVSDAK